MQNLFQKFRLLAVTAAFLLLVTYSLHAQVSTGAISGTVIDSTGAAIPGATVTVTNRGTGASNSLTTDNNGFYSAEGLSVGQYNITVVKAGFQQNVTQAIQLDPGQRRGNNVTLKIGSASTKVTVTANAQQVNTQTSESGGTITSKQMSNLMLNGRNFQTLAIAVPGVSSVAGADAQNGGGFEGGTTLIVNGQSVEYTTYTIDGVYNMNSGNLAGLNITPIIDGIDEVRVLKDNYAANYGFAGSGQIIVQTKSGTDTFHGSAWDYLRNNAFDANNFFSTTTQALHQNIFGYTLGGPLVIPHLYNTDRKKTFFFASNQWYVISAGTVQTGSVFTQEMRSGNFSASPTLPTTGGTNPQPLPLSLDAHSAALLASEGKTGCIIGPTTLNPACFDPVAVAVLNAYIPLPNNPGGGFLNYINQGANTTSQLDYQYRVDHYINSANELTARVMYEPVKNGFPYDAWAGFPYSTITDSYYQTGFNGLVRLASTITPNLLNTVSVAETYDKPRIANTKGGTLPSGITVQQSFPGADPYDRIPQVSISGGWTGNGTSTQPITASDGEGTIADDVSWVKGNHALQAGALYIFGIKRQDVFTYPQGNFTFTGVHTGDPAADYLLGLNTTYSQSSSQKIGSFHYREGDAYVQDNWKATPRLNINLGVRWVYFSNDTASGDQVSNFDPAVYNPNEAPVVNIDGSLQINAQNQPITSSGQPANLLNGLIFAGKNGVSSGFFTPVKTNFGPKVGFAYDVFGNGKTSIRGGYGIGYQRIPLEVIYSAFGQNPPYNNSANILNSLLSNGTAGASAAPTTQTLSDVPLKFKPASIQSFSLTVEQQLLPSMIATVAYAGSVGRNLESLGGAYDGNFPLPVTAPSAPGCLAPDQGASSSYNFDPCINTGTASRDYTRPYKGYSAMNDEYWHGSSNYNSLQTGITYRAGASQFSVAYTYSKSLATVGGHGAGAGTSQGSGIQNMYNVHAEYGPPDYDFTHDITATWVYNIPYFMHDSKPVTMALGNWSFAGLAIHQTGFALSPGMATSTAGLAIRPDLVAPYHRIGKLSEWFDPASFAAPPYGFFGDASNGIIRGPGYTSVNVSLYKTFPITSRFNTQFRAEAFNVANHPNFSGVSTSYGSANFGQVTSARDPRILEFALKLIY